MRLAPLVVLLLAVPCLSGCGDLLGDLNRPNYHVRVTQLDQDGWNTVGQFEVQVDEDAAIHIEATRPSDGKRIAADGMHDVFLQVPDGTWDLQYSVGGHGWGSYAGLRFDATPPTIVGLVAVADASATGHYRLGAGATITDAVAIAVYDLQSGALLANQLPVDLNGLTDGLHVYLVSTRDAAGNYGNVTVQVRAGSAQDLPVGKFTFGVVARYTNSVQLWSASDLAAYVTTAQAKQQTAGHYLGASYGITPDDPAVQAVVSQVVTSQMTTAERAEALLRYMMENLHYDTKRLDNDNLLTPAEVLLDSEDEQGRDCLHAGDADCDGLVMSGSGNGVKGGICRDLAAAYVSLLRAADVPARLVSGYLSGNVNGFHAWVEFYGGRPADLPSQAPWIPVDVSIVDGTYSDGAFLQAFGIQRPDYLTLRKVPEYSEVEGWSTAIGVHYEYPGTRQPDITFEKSVTSEFTDDGVLCFDQASHERLVAGDQNHCGGLSHWIPLPRAATRVIDYGILVRSAPSRTHVTAEVSYPFPDPDPGNPVYGFYHDQPFRTDVTAGKAIADFTV